MKCKHCGVKLSAKELRELKEAQEECDFPPEPICDECFDAMEDFPEEEYFSDADPGL